MWGIMKRHLMVCFNKKLPILSNLIKQKLIICLKLKDKPQKI